MDMHYYNSRFYLRGRPGARSSAEVIVPIVIRLVKPKSVIDVGCGDGTWLSVFAEHGIIDFVGIDGKWVDKKLLRISKEHFIVHDLATPFKMNRKFDLVSTLEVAEHLPKKCAEILVNTLVNLGSVILFSAAIPFQGGANHFNEQWLDYWANLFSYHNYVPVDAIRGELWSNEKVGCRYIQNTLFFVDLKVLERYPLLFTAYKSTNRNMLAIVHPRLYLEKYADIREPMVRQVYRKGYSLIRELYYTAKVRISKDVKR